MYWKLSLLTLAIAIVATFYYMVAGTENWGPSFLAGASGFLTVSVFMIGPYVGLGALTLALRTHRMLSLVLLVIVLVVSVSGVVALSIEVNTYLSRDKSLPEVQRMGSFLIGVAQWGTVALTSAILVPVFFYGNGDITTSGWTPTD